MMLRSRSTKTLAAPKSVVSSCGSNPPFNYCGTERKERLSVDAYDKQIAGSLRLRMRFCAIVCRRVKEVRELVVDLRCTV